MLKTMPLWKNAMLHLLPGAAVTLVYLVLSAIITTDSMPEALTFYLSGLSILARYVYYYEGVFAQWQSRRRSGIQGKAALRQGCVFRRHCLSLGCIGHGCIQAGIEQNLFGWMAKRFDLTGFVTNPGQYPKAMLILTWAVGLATTSTLLPGCRGILFSGISIEQTGTIQIVGRTAARAVIQHVSSVFHHG